MALTERVEPLLGPNSLYIPTSTRAAIAAPIVLDLNLDNLHADPTTLPATVMNVDVQIGDAVEDTAAQPLPNMGCVQQMQAGATEQRVNQAARVALALTVGCVLTTGCTVMAPRTSPLPVVGATMSEIYRTHMNGADIDGPTEVQSPRERMPSRAVDADSAAQLRRTLSDPLNNRFERLPNPDLVLYVFPHLAPGRYPVPGYTTVFPMYESIQYAMPGEVAPRQAAKTPPATVSPLTIPKTTVRQTLTTREMN